jgi:hypothetical protein
MTVNGMTPHPRGGAFLQDVPMNKNWWLAGIGVLAAIGFLSSNSDGGSVSDCITASRSGDNIVYRNSCKSPVNAHYCTEQVASNFFGRSPQCKVERVGSGEIMAFSYSPEGGGNNLLQSSLTMYVSKIAVCEPPTQPRFIDNNSYECR